MCVCLFVCVFLCSLLNSTEIAGNNGVALIWNMKEIRHTSDLTIFIDLKLLFPVRTSRY